MRVQESTREEKKRTRPCLSFHKQAWDKPKNFSVFDSDLELSLIQWFSLFSALFFGGTLERGKKGAVVVSCCCGRLSVCNYAHTAKQDHPNNPFSLKDGPEHLSYSGGNG